MSKARAWCFTLNNYTDIEVEAIKGINCRYIVFGKEVGENGTPHLQGYIEFDNPRSLGGVKKLLGVRVHLEVRRGTPKEASDYCKKADLAFYEQGEMSTQGKRSDILEVREKISSGVDLDTVIEEDFELYCKYRNGFKDLANIISRKKTKTEMTEGFWYYGKTGTGKSHTAFSMAGDDYFVWTNDGGWWDGYHGQHTVIINDFRGGIEYGLLLQLIDKWPVKVRRRGQEPMPFTSKRLIITSSLPPKEVYYNLSREDSLDQLYRRIKLIHICELCRTGTEVHHGNTGHGVPCECRNEVEIAFE